MQKLWYCKKCKRLYKTNPGIRCHNGDRIHETTMDMLSGYEEKGYQFLEDKKKALLQEYSLDKIIQEFKMMEEPKKPEPKKPEPKKPEAKKEEPFVLTKGKKPPVIEVLPVVPLPIEEPKKPEPKKEEPKKPEPKKPEPKKEKPERKAEPERKTEQPKPAVDVKAQLEALGLKKVRR